MMTTQSLTITESEELESLERTRYKIADNLGTYGNGDRQFDTVTIYKTVRGAVFHSTGDRGGKVEYIPGMPADTDIKGYLRYNNKELKAAAARYRTLLKISIG